ncbi:titin-like [Haliotis rubra]|uniref:titin-like n=1 Tax=Haliotis rubra TaxID=36100 RepID=UPI001EE553F1|nr:titin-like [Haliotis rubra]
MKLEDGKGKEGEDVTFKCKTNDDDIPVFWFINGKPVPIPSDKYVIKSDGYEHTLTIKNLLPEDACEVTAVIGDNKTSADLAVQEVSADFTIPLKDVTAKENTTAEFECTLTIPVDNVQWFIDGEEITQDAKYQFVDDGRVHKLIIKDVAPEDAGTVTVKVGNKSSEAQFIVEEIDVDFTVPLEDKTTYEKSSVDFVVELNKETDKLKWYQDGEELKTMEGIKIVQDGKTHKLTLEDVAVEDTGKITAKVGDKSTECQLTVNPLPLEFTVPLNDVTAIENSTAEFVCELSRDVEKVKWFLNDVELKESDKIKFISDGKTKKLQIKDVKVEEEGPVSIMADDKKTTASLFVIELSPDFLTPLKDLTIDELQTAEFMCEVNKDGATPKWFLDGQEINEDKRYQIISDGRTHKLIIKEATLPDSGEITAKVEDKKTSANLTVKEIPVEFTAQLSEQHVEEHKIACFKCEVNKEDVSVTWEKESAPIEPSNKHIIQQEGTSHTLVIKDCDKDDVAEYSVVVGDQKSSARLRLDEAPLEFTIPLGAQTCMEGETVTFVCEVTEADQPAKWMKNGMELKPSDKIKMEVDGKIHRLIISPAELDDQSEYTIMIRSAQSTAPLTVEEIPLEIIVPLKEIECVEGENITLLCEINRPDMEVVWMKDKVEISSTEDRQIKMDGTKHTLTFPKVALEDEAEYTIKIRNKKSAAILFVEETPVYFVKTLEDLEALEGDNSFQLDVTLSKPDVHVDWHFDDVQLQPSEKYEFVISDADRSLLVYDINLDDEGEYSCRVGDISTTAFVAVLEEPLRITVPLSDNECLEGETVSFICEISKENVPVAWMKDGLDISEEDGYQFIIDGKQHILKIPDANLYHDAEYTIVVGNNESSARLFVEEMAADFVARLQDAKAKETEDVELVCQLSKIGVPVRWMKNRKPLEPSERIKIVCDRYRHMLRIMETIPEDEAEYTIVLPDNKESSCNLTIYSLPPDFCKPLKDQECEEKETVMFECGMTKANVPVKWFINGEELSPDSDQYEISTDIYTQQLIIHDVTLKDAGEVKCVCGDNWTSATLTVEALPVEILRPLKDATIMEGESVLFECELSKPDMEVQWLKDYEPFTPREGIKITSDGAIHRLEIEAGVVDDEADYTIKVNGKSSKAMLLVEETPLEIVKPLTDISIMEHENIQFVCELNKPNVKVRWLRDGKEVMADDGFVAVSDGCVHTLSLDDALVEHNAKIMIVAQDKKSSATLTVKAEPVKFIRPLADITVTEKQDIYLECEINKPGLKPTWKIDGNKVSASGRFQLLSEGNVHKLIIKEAELDDENVYTVTFDDVTSTASVLVDELPIEITKPLKDLEIMEGTSLTLTCEVNKPNIPSKWMRNGEEITPSERIEMTVDDTRHTLTIPKSEVDDEAVYKCVIKDRKTSARVTVKEEPFEFLQPLTDVHVMETETIHMECVVSKPGKPATWYKEGVKMLPSDRVKMGVDGAGKYMLTITNAELKDEAEYSIKIADKKSKAQALVEEEDVDIIRPLEDIDISEIPSTAVFECELSKPHVMVQWNRETEVLLPSDKYEIIHDGCVHRLIISDVTEKDEAEYSIHAKSKRSDAGLFVEAPPKILYDKRFDETIILHTGQSTAWEVPFSGNPQPKCTWLYNGGSLPDKKRIEAETIDNMTTIRLAKVIRTDTGDYTLSLENPNGKATITIKLIVLDKPSQVRDLTVCDITAESATVKWEVPADDGGKPITGYIIEKRESGRRSFYEVGSTTDLQFTVPDLVEGNQYVFRVFAQNEIGKSEPVESDNITAKHPFNVPDKPDAPEVSDIFKDSAVISWKPPANDGGSPVTGYLLERKSGYSPRYIQVTKEPVAELTFKDVDLLEDNTYQYRVIAVNKAGPSEPSEPSTEFTAKDPWGPPGPPGKPEVTGTDKKSVALKWAPPEEDGGSPITNYVVEYRPKDSYNWQRKSDGIVPDTTFSVTGLKENFGIGVPPVIIEPLQDEVAVAPKDAILECDVDVGEPEGEIKWFKGTKEVKKSSKYEMSYEDEVASLVIHKTEPSDTARYKCEVTNPLGQVSTEGQLAIHTAPALEYDNRLKSAQTVKGGSTLVLQVNVSGIPSPKISWFLDDEPLEKSERISVDTTDDFSTLTIKNAMLDDTGMYTIAAENVVGKAEADFEINVKDLMEIIHSISADKPSMPNNLHVIDIMKDSIVLSWETPSDTGGCDLSGYFIEKRDAKRNTWMPVHTVDGSTNTYAVIKLLEGNEYFFRVSAENEVGVSEPAEMDEGTIAKCPYDVPQTPRKLKASEVTRSSVTLTWEPPESDGGSPITSYIIEKKSPTNKPDAPRKPEVVDVTKDSVTLKWLAPEKDGGSPIFNYAVEMRVSGNVRWVQASQNIKIPETSYKVPELMEGAEYEFRIMAENKAGLGPPSSPSQPVVAKDPIVGEAPAVLEGLPDLAVMEGETAILECKISGEPEPSIKWMKDRRDVTEDKRHEIFYEDMFASLTITECTERDAGSYTCEASNDLGTVTTSGQLDIQAPPVLEFDNKFRDLITLHAGSNLKIPVKVKGIPTPRITWAKDDQPMRSAGKVTIDTHDTSTSLTIKKVSKEEDGLYTLTAENEAGEDKAKFDVEVIDVPSKPGPIEYADIVRDGVTLNWTPPKDDGGTDIISYIVERRDAKRSTYTRAGKVEGNVTQLKVSGLVEGTEYFFQVTAENEVGKSEPRESDSGVVPKSPFGKPSAPEDLEHSDITEDSVTLTWKPPKSDGGSPLTEYIIEKRDVRKTSWSKVASVKSDTLNYNVKKLLEDTPYLFRVIAVNAEGPSEPIQSEHEIVPKKAPEVPGKPVGPIEFSNIGEDTVTLEWSKPKRDGGAKIVKYNIEVYEDGKWRPLDSVDAPTTQYTAKKLKDGKKYKFRVSAVNSVGVGEPLDSDNVTPTKKISPPSKPVGPLDISNVQRDSATLKWKAPKDDGGSPLTGYIIEKRDAKKSTWSKAGKVKADTLEYVVDGLLENNEYFFRVIAENKAGQSEPLEADAATKAKSPYNKPSKPRGPLLIENVTDHSCDLEWKAPESDGGLPLKNYIIEMRPATRSTWSKAGKVDGQTLKFTPDNLIEGTEYLFRIIAVNDEGESEPLEGKDSAKPKKALKPPGPPQNLQPGHVGQDYVAIEWKPPKEDGGAKVTHYKIEKCEETSEEWVKVAEIKSYDTAYKIEKLKENVGYFFAVTAKNEVGYSEIAETDSVITPKKPAGKPSKPQEFKTSKIDRTSVTLEWKPPKDDGGSPLTGYIVERREASRSSWTKLDRVKADKLTLEAVSLIEGTEYYFRVSAENKIGVSEPTELDKAVTPKSPYDKPSKPRGPLLIENVTDHSCDLEWKAPESDGGLPLKNYIIEMRPATRSTWSKAGKVDGQTLKFTPDDLIEGTEYLFRIIAVNDEGESEPLEGKESAKPKKALKPPGPPQNLQPGHVGQDYVAIEWKPPKEDGGAKVTHYKIEKCEETSEEWVKVAEIKSYDTAYKIEKLKENVGYFFAVTAKNEVGYSEIAETDSVITPKKPAGKPSKPQEFKTSKIDRISVTLEWKPPKDDGGSPLTGYIVERREASRSSWTKLDRVKADKLTLEAVNLIEGTEYYFRVSAENKIGVSEPTELDKAVTPKSPYDKPSKPRGPLLIENVTDPPIHLVQGGKVDGQTLKFTPDNLIEGTEYLFRIIAVNDEGESEPLEGKESAKPKKALKPPGPPQNLQPGHVGQDYVAIEWKPPKEDGGAKVTHYKIEKCEETSEEWVKVAEIKSYDTAYKIEKLKENVGYFFAVTAKNEVFHLQANHPKPQEFKTSKIDRTSVTLEWKPPKDDGGSPLTGYIVERREASRSSWTKLDRVKADKLTLEAVNLIEGTEYYFRVSAENKIGVSEPTELDKSVTPKSPYDKPSKPRGPLLIENVTDHSCDLEWKAPESDGGLPIKNYIIEMRPDTRTTWSKAGKVDGQTLKFTPDNLNEGTDYLFRIIAVNDEGESEPLVGKDSAKPRKALKPPGPPQNLQPGHVGQDYVAIEWKPPKEDGGAKVTHYKIEKCEETSEEWVKVAEIKSYDTAYKIEKLKENVGYFFAVTAKNEVGYSEIAETDSVITPKKPAGKPSKPQEFKTSKIDRTSVTLEWKPPKDDGGSPLTGYIVERREASRSTWTKLDRVKADKLTLEAVNLIEGTEYYFRVSAENKIGVSEPTELDKAVTPKSPYDKPSKPRGPLLIENVTDHSCDLEWKAPESDGGLPLKNYIIQMRPATRTTWSKAGRVDGQTLKFTPDNLDEGTEYLFRVIAVNDEGESEPLDSKETIKPMKSLKPPGPPQNLKPGRVGQYYVALEWNPPKEDGGAKVTHYKIEKCEEKSKDWVKVDEVKSYDTAYKVEKLKENVGYFFAVTAKNEVGYGESAETDSVIKPRKPEGPPGPPKSLKTADVERTSLNLVWEPPIEDGGSPITGYIIERREASRTKWTKIDRVDAKTLKTKAQNLVEGTEYSFQVSAENKVGVSEPIEIDRGVTPKSQFTKPSKPRGPIETDNLTDHSVDLKWKVPDADGGLPITGYIIEYRPASRSSWMKSGKVDGKTLTFTANDLREGQEYFFRVIAVNDEGESEPLVSQDAVKPAKELEPPGPPRNLRPGRIGQYYVALEWNPPKEDGGAKVTHYKIEKKEEKAKEWTTVEEVKSYDTAYKVENLKENVGLLFRVSAKNQVGYGSSVETDAVITPKKPEGPPSAPEGPVKFSDVDRTAVTFSWSPPKSDGGSPLTGYILERREASRPKWTPLDRVEPKVLSHRAEKLIEGTEYNFRISAENKHGISEPLETETGTVLKSPYNKPSKPRGPLNVDNVTCDTADLTWKSPDSDGGLPIKNYIIEMRPSSKMAWSKIGKVDADKTSFTAQDLKDGTDYYFRVIAVNDEGDSDALETKDTIRPLKKILPPGSPRGLKVTKVGPDFVILDWKAPLEDGGAKVTNYKIEKCEETSEEWVKVEEVKSYDTSFKVEKLKENVGFYFAVSAKNEVGFSEPAETEDCVKPKKPETKPHKCESLTAKDLDRTELTLEWTPPKNDGGSPITQYILEKKEAKSPTWSRIDKVPSKKTSYHVANLLEGTEYVFRITAENKHGAGEPLETSKGYTPKSLYDKPSKPLGPLKFSDITHESVVLTWQPSESDGGTPLTGYLIEYRDVRRPTWMKTTTVGPDVHKHTVKDLIEGSEYYFRVTAINAEGPSQPLESKDTVKPQRELSPPGAPAGIKVKDIGKDSVTLTWTPPKDDGGSKVTGYVIKVREEKSKDWTKAGNVRGTENTFVVKDLKEEHGYFFSVTAENKIGTGQTLETESPISPKRPIAKPAAPEGPIEFSEIQKTSLTLTWKAPKSDGGSPLTGYAIERRDGFKMTWSPVTVVKPNMTSFCVQNLKEGHDYVFRVSAENLVGRSDALESDKVIPKSPFKVPSAPEAPIEATEITATSVSIKWNPPKSDGGTPLTAYIIERRDATRMTWIHVDKVKPNITSYCIQGLVTNNEYFFRVIAENAEGMSPPLDSPKFKPIREAEAPRPPKGPVRFNDVEATSLTLTWYEPEDDGGSPLTDYIIEVSADQVDWSEFKKVDSRKTDYKAHNLKEGKKLYFRIKAVNAVGVSKPVESESVTPRRPPELPGKPVGPLEVTDIQRTNISIRWKPPKDDGGVPLTAYVIEKRDAKRMTWAKVDRIKPDITTYTVQNLVEGSEYFFRVFAENSVGLSKPLESDRAFIPKSPFDVPSAPTGPIKVFDVTEDSCVLEWKPPQSDGGTPLTKYIIEMRDVRRSTWNRIDSVKPTELEYEVFNLVLGNEYMFRIIAVNAEGEGPPLNLKETVQPMRELEPPGPPLFVRVSKITKKSVTIDWGTPSDDGGSKITRYHIYTSKKTRGEWKEVAKVKAFDSDYEVQDLEEGQDYFFAVAAENEVGIGKMAETEAAAKPQKPMERPSPPTPPLEATDIQRDSVTLTWKASKSDGGSPILHYVLQKREGWKTSWTEVAKVKPNIFSYCVQNLHEGQEYYFRVFAENQVGASDAIQTEVGITPRSPFNKPSAPEGPLEILEITANTVTIQWKTPKSNGGLALTAYYIERRDKKHTSWLKVDMVKPSIKSYCIQKLLEGNEYFFRVLAENPEGLSEPLESLEPVMPREKPAAPLAPIGPVRFHNILSTSLALDWLPPRDDGGEPITEYLIEACMKGGEWFEVGKTNSSTTKLKVKDLKEGKTYEFRICARNKIGLGKPLESEPVVPCRPPEVPSKPVGPIKVSDIDRFSCVIAWKPPEDDGGSPLKSYILEKRDMSRTKWNRIDKIDASITNFCCQNLQTGSEYYFRVSAENKIGVSKPLEMDKPVLIKSPYDVPSPPKFLKAANVNEKTADIEWKAPDSDGGLPLTGYVIQFRESRRSIWNTFCEVEATMTSIKLTDLVPGNEYVVAVVAVNEEGQSPPAIISEPIRPQKHLRVPGPPENLQLRNMTKVGLTLEWNPPSDDGGTKVRRYHIEKCTVDSKEWERVETVEHYRSHCGVSD